MHKTLETVMTPAAVVDLDRMDANLDRMATYAASHNLRLRPHTKTHKAPEIAALQIARGASGLTVATLREADVMSDLDVDLLLAHPPVGKPKLDRLVRLASHANVTVALDSIDALDPLIDHMRRHNTRVGVVVEIDLGMHRVGVQSVADALAVTRRAADASSVDYRGILFYPGHIREHIDAQNAAVSKLNDDLASYLNAFHDAGLNPEIVSGGSTPAAYSSHRLDGLTEMRPGTYVYNDRTTMLMGACAWDDCAYSILATVVSTAVPDQAVIDAGSKSIFREEMRSVEATGFGALLDRPDVVVKGMSEEHGLLDLSHTDWRPRIGDRVRVVPNHVCVSVNLQEHIFGVRGDVVESRWAVAARGWSD
jgi:D-serine deaminase-like pyridoxal phosphate-dependent protein